jgi:hypothetical protein
MDEAHRMYQRNENIVYRRIYEEAILVPIKNNVGDMGFIYNLNEVGAFVWEHLDGRNRLADIQTMLVEAFDVSREEAQRDLWEFVGQLKEIDAIVPVTVTDPV